MHFLHIAFNGKLTIREDIPNVSGYNRLISLEKLYHLRLSQPDSFVI